MSVLDNLMEQSLAEVETAPEYLTPPNGRYTLLIKKSEPAEVKTKNGIQVVVNLDYSIASTIELTDTSVEEVEEGSLFRESFFLNEQGIPFFKRYLSNVFSDVDSLTLMEAITALNGLTIEATVRTKTSNDRDYTSTSRQSSV